MLTYLEESTLRNAIMKRLHVPGKTEIAEIRVLNMPDAKPPHIQVGIWAILKDRINIDGLIDTRSYFDLPAEFGHSHLLNEIDEVAEQIKVARKETRVSKLVFRPDLPQRRGSIIGTGLRGNWPEKAPERLLDHKG